MDWHLSGRRTIPVQPHPQQFELYDESLKNILTMAEDSLDHLWAGDFSSLIQMDPVQKNHTRYPMGYAVRVIHEDKNGDFWIGTEGGGALVIQSENREIPTLHR